MTDPRVHADGPRRLALVTGASSGIGEAFADVLAGEGFDVVITARREAKLREVQTRLQEKYGVRVEVIVEDLNDAAAPARLCAALEARGLNIDVLVNNAGYGVPGSYLASGWDVHARFLQIMVIAVSELTYRLLPGMLARRYGRIINVASLAGLVPAPAGHTLYAATKAIQLKPARAGERVLAFVVRTGFATQKGALILSILFPKPSDFKFVSQSFKFTGSLFAVAFCGFAPGFAYLTGLDTISF